MTRHQQNYLLCFTRGQHGYMFRPLNSHLQTTKVYRIKITIQRTSKSTIGPNTTPHPHSCTVHFDTFKVFYLPTDAK